MKHRQPIVVLVATVFAILAGGMALGQTHDYTRATMAAAPWSQPVQLSGHGAIGSPGGTHPLAFDKNTYAAWVQHGVIHLSTSDDGGVTWGHATRVTAHNTALYPCSLELSDAMLHLVWPDTRNHGLAEPYYQRSADGGKTWTEGVRLSPGTDLFRIGTAVSGSAIHVVWFNRHFLEKVPAGDQPWAWTWGEVYYCRSTDGGVTWEKAIRLTQPDSTACRPVVAASGRFVHVAWLDNREARQEPGWDWEIYYKRSTDGGATWGPDVRMSHNEWHSRHPQIMARCGDRVCCVWEDGAIWDGRTSSGWSGDGALYAAVSNDNGRTWKPPQRMTTVNSPNGRATHAKSFAVGLRLFVGWTDAVEGAIHKPIRAEAAYFIMSTDGGVQPAGLDKQKGMRELSDRSRLGNVDNCTVPRRMAAAVGTAHERRRRSPMRDFSIAALVIVAGLGRWASADPVDHNRPLQVDKKEDPGATAGTSAPARLPGVTGREDKAGETVAPTFVLPWGMDADPTDESKSHVQEIIAGTQTYNIVQGGTMDGCNCRTPMGVGMNSEGAIFQTWESNRAVRMENVGDTDVVNPWLSNGRNNFRNVAEIVQSAITPDMTDAEKAYAIWFQEIRHRHHSGGDNNELGDPVKVFNVYGYNTCGNDSICLGTLWKEAGFQTAPARALGHCISQVFYDDAWHFLDGDLHCVYLLRDNETVANDVQLARDHDLVKRTHSNGILLVDTQWDGQGTSALYFTECEITGQRAGRADTTMNMVLRPGEAIVWRWGQWNPVKYHGALYTMPKYKHTIYNGLWGYRPDLSRATWRQGATTVENIRSGTGGLIAEDEKTGLIVWTMKSPYVFVGGRIEAEGNGARFLLCQDGKRWQEVSGANLDPFFSTVGPPCYEYQVKCELETGASLKAVAIINDVQMAPAALPEMAVGENSFTYSDQTSGTRSVRITHEWVERSATRPPVAPEAVYPVDGGESDGTDIAFQWTIPTDPDGDGIKDYQFELSRRSDMRFPLSMSFYKLSSRTLDAARKWTGQGFEFSDVKPQYTLSEPGLLTPDTTYYWHVRAMDAQGVWGPWSKTFNFTARGAAYPLDVTLKWNVVKGIGTLKWRANPVGRRPVKYRVYGSDEKGFTVMDKPRQLSLGTSAKTDMAEWNPWAPPNFIAETTDTQFVVMGTDAPPAGNKTYYRVVAVDERDKRSGPSGYVFAPRPVIYSEPITTAIVGEEYKYQVRANRSLGDLSARAKDGGQVSGYFDIEKPEFQLTQGPPWLKIDQATGLLHGTPDTPGEFSIVVSASIDREVRELEEAALIWGREKVLAVTTERVGTAVQKFVIVVRP